MKAFRTIAPDGTRGAESFTAPIAAAVRARELGDAYTIEEYEVPDPPDPFDAIAATTSDPALRALCAELKRRFAS